MRSRTDKPWGWEELMEHNERYAFKRIRIHGGRRTSLQTHAQKMETCYVTDGFGKLELDGEETSLRPGSTWTVKPGQIHRVSSRTLLEYLEVSSPELDDITRLEDDFGRA